MPVYTMRCGRCDVRSEHIMGMDDNMVLVKCPSCGSGLSRSRDRDWGTDGRTMQIQGDTVAGGCSYDYYDESLGVHIRSKQHRQDEMKKQGLRPFTPDPDLKKIREERTYIRKHSQRSDGQANRELAKLAKESQSKRRKKQIDRAFDSVPLPDIPID